MATIIRMKIQKNVKQIFQVLHPYFVVSGQQETSRSCDHESLADTATMDSETSILH